MKAQRLALKLLSQFTVFSFLTFAFFILSLQFMEFENGVYLRYLKSMLHDFDFNIINQFSDPLDRWMITPKYNHPDIRSPFISILLFFPYLLTNGILIPWREHFIQQIPYFSYYIAYLLSSVAIFRIESNLETSYKRMLFFCLISSVGVWYFLFDPGEPSLLCVPLTTYIFVNFFFYHQNSRSHKISILVALSLFLLLKPDAYFWFIPSLFLILQTRDKKFISYSVLLFSFAFFMIHLTNRARFGVDTTFISVLQFDTWRSHSHLFGPVGLFKYTPAFFFAYLALIFGSIFHKGTIRRACLFAISIITLKFFILGFLKTDNMDTFAGRMFLTELPLWAFGYYLIWNYSKKLAWLIISFSLFRNIYHLEIILAYWTSDWMLVDTVNYISRRGFFSFEGFTTFWRGAQRFYEYRLSFYDYYILRRILLVAMTTGATITILAQIRFKFMSKITLSTLTGLALTFFILNLSYNSRNTNDLKVSGYFDKSVVAKNEALHYDEYLDFINNLEFMTKTLGKPGTAYTEEIKADYLKKVKENIIHDPIGFLNDLERGQIRPSFWQLK